MRVAVPALPGERGAAVAAYLAERLSAGGPGVQTIGQAEIEAVLGPERLPFCKGDAACLAEAAAPLGTDVLVVGEEVDGVASFRAISARSGEVLASWQKGVVDEKEMNALVDIVAARVRELFVPVETPSRGPSIFRFLPVVMGGVLIAGAGALLGYAHNQHRRLVNGDSMITSLELAEGLAARGRSIETTAWLLGGIGAVLAGGGLLFAFFAPESDVRLGAMFTDGLGIAVSGRLP